MPQININEYLLNKYGIRISDINRDLTSEEYNAIMTDLLRVGIPKITSKLCLNNSDNIDTILDKYQILLDSPTDIDHLKFKAYLNRFYYSYENCYAMPKKVTMRVIDETSFYYDSASSHAVNRIGISYLEANLNLNYNSYTVYYKTYTANADHTVTAIDEVKTSTTAASYDSDRKIFSIMLSGNDGRFLQNCVYDVDIEYCGSDFIDYDEDAYSPNSVSSLYDLINELHAVDDISDLPTYGDTSSEFVVQKYLNKYISIFNKSLKYAIVSDDFNNCIIRENDSYLSFANCELLILSNIRYATDIRLSNVKNAILINCNTIYLHVDRQSIVSCINCNISSIDECIVNDSAAKFTNCVMSRSIEDYVPLLSINNSSVSFNGCRFICPTDLFYLQTSVIFDFKDSNISLNESELIVINSNDNIKNNILTNCEISYNHFYAHINNISGTTIKTELWEEYE